MNDIHQEKSGSGDVMGEFFGVSGFSANMAVNFCNQAGIGV
jgi:hypothetical protein